MTDLQATLDAIEQVAVHQCGNCSEPLRVDGPSADFCSQWCQSTWLTKRHEVQELVGYQEPYDLPVHVGNLHELSSPETTPVDPDDGWDRHMGYGGDLTYEFHFDASPWYEAWGRLQDRINQVWEVSNPHGIGEYVYEMRRSAMAHDDRVLFQGSPGWVIYDEIRPFGVVLNSLRVTAPEPEIVVVEPDEPPFGSDFDFEQTPAKSLPHEPPPAVMPALPERDWQAVVDRALSGGYWTPDSLRGHVARSIGRRSR